MFLIRHFKYKSRLDEHGRGEGIELGEEWNVDGRGECYNERGYMAKQNQTRGLG